MEFDRCRSRSIEISNILPDVNVSVSIIGGVVLAVLVIPASGMLRSQGSFVAAIMGLVIVAIIIILAVPRHVACDILDVLQSFKVHCPVASLKLPELAEVGCSQRCCRRTAAKAGYHRVSLPQISQISRTGCFYTIPLDWRYPSIPSCRFRCLEESYARGRSPTQIMDHEQNNEELIFDIDWRT